MPLGGRVAHSSSSGVRAAIAGGGGGATAYSYPTASLPASHSSGSLHRDEDAERQRRPPFAVSPPLGTSSSLSSLTGVSSTGGTTRVIRRFPLESALSSAPPLSFGGSSGDSIALNMMQPASSLSSGGGAGLGLSSGLKRDDDALQLRGGDTGLSTAVQMEELGGRGVSSSSVSTPDLGSSPDGSHETHMLLSHSSHSSHHPGPHSASHRRLMMAPVSGPPPSATIYTSSNNWKVFEQGMRFGCMLSLLTWVMWDCIVDAKLRPADQDLWLQLVLPIYRGFGCLLLLGWCAGISTFVWERSHINYLFLLDAGTGSVALPGSTLSNGGLMSYTEIWDECTNVTIVFLANFLLYFKVMRGDFPMPLVASGYFPVGFVLYMTLKILPWSYWIGWSATYRNAPLWAGLAQVPLAPFGKVTFLTGYLGDIWTSMVKVSVDLAYTGCFIATGDWLVEIDVLAAQREAAAAAALATSGDALASAGSSPLLGPGKIETCFQSFFFKRALIPLLSALPLWLRMMQCLRKFLNTKKRWPNLANALKYAFAHSVVLFGVYNAATFSGASSDSASSGLKFFWVLSMVLSTLYTFWWDVYQDWGLGSWKHAGLREELMFKANGGGGAAAAEKAAAASGAAAGAAGSSQAHRGVYYAAMAVDLVMRFAWTLTLIPVGEDSPFPPEFLLFLQPMLAAGEILRRTMWGFFRLEWEHISTQGYHRVPEAVVQTTQSPDMTGYRVILEVAVVVVMVLCVGTTAALTAN